MGHSKAHGNVRLLISRQGDDKRMNAEIVAIGTEILLGEIVDTNSAWSFQEANPQIREHMTRILPMDQEISASSVVWSHLIRS